jgi:hypothetical protein
MLVQRLCTHMLERPRETLYAYVGQIPSDSVCVGWIIPSDFGIARATPDLEVGRRSFAGRRSFGAIYVERPDICGEQITFLEVRRCTRNA